MTVKELILELSKYDQDQEIEIQYYNVSGCQTISRPSIDHDIDIYETEDESSKNWKRVVIDLWDF